MPTSNFPRKRSDAQAENVTTMYRFYRERRLRVNRKYQRKLVWTLEEKQNLVHSLINQYPIPAVILAEFQGKFDIIDGMQRLHAIFSFIDGQYSTQDGRLFDKSVFSGTNGTIQAALTTKTAEDPARKMLASEEQDSFVEYKVPLVVLRDADDTDVEEVFRRINTYGRRLSEQESRQAGASSEFSELVRQIAAERRGDATLQEVVDLSSMPAVSINTPRSDEKSGIDASSTFWVTSQVLTAADLRNSADEQCIAEVVYGVVTGKLPERKKEVLDKIYADAHSWQEPGQRDSTSPFNALQTKGSSWLKTALLEVFQEAEKIQDATDNSSLRAIMVEHKNSFPAKFAALLLVLYKLRFEEDRFCQDYKCIADKLRDIRGTDIKGKAAATENERAKYETKLYDAIQGFFTKGKPVQLNTQSSSIEISNVIRNAVTENGHIEFKQGLLTLSEQRSVDKGVFEKVARTVVAMTNSQMEATGHIVVGVADSEKHTSRIVQKDQITPYPLNGRNVVGIDREAKFLGESLDTYLSRWREGINNVGLPEQYKSQIFDSIFLQRVHRDLHVLIIRTIPWDLPLTIDGVMFRRNIDQNIQVSEGAERDEFVMQFAQRTIPRN